LGLAGSNDPGHHRTNVNPCKHKNKE